jgi:hypothetical protein
MEWKQQQTLTQNHLNRVEVFVGINNLVIPE